jgi:hypothetical protein
VAGLDSSPPTAYDLPVPVDPEKERRRLVDLYARMPLAQLQSIASDPMSLTETARTTIEAELRRRGISEVISERAPANQSDEGTENEADASRLVVLCRFRDLQEALLAQGMLDSAGIQSFMADENTVRMNWMWSNAISGIRLLVRVEDAPEAAHILDQPIPQHLDIPHVGEYQQPGCPRCGSLEVSFEGLNKVISYGSLLVGIPFPLHRQGWKCQGCGHTWSEEG